MAVVATVAAAAATAEAERVYCSLDGAGIDAESTGCGLLLEFQGEGLVVGEHVQPEWSSAAFDLGNRVVERVVGDHRQKRPKTSSCIRRNVGSGSTTSDSGRRRVPASTPPLRSNCTMRAPDSRASSSSASCRSKWRWLMIPVALSLRE